MGDPAASPGDGKKRKPDIVRPGEDTDGRADGKVDIGSKSGEGLRGRGVLSNSSLPRRISSE